MTERLLRGGELLGWTSRPDIQLVVRIDRYRKIAILLGSDGKLRRHTLGYVENVVSWKLLSAAPELRGTSGAGQDT